MAEYGTVTDWTGMESLEQDDPDVLAIIKKEKIRQRSGLELIASEVWLIMARRCYEPIVIVLVQPVFIYFWYYTIHK